MRWRTIGVAACFFVAVACGTDTSEPGSDAPLTKVRHYLGVNASPGTTPWFLGVEKGFYEDAGLDVELIEGETQSASPSLVAEDKADLASIDLTLLALAKVEQPGLPVRMVMTYHARTIQAVFSLESGANIAEPAGLEGVTVYGRIGGVGNKVIETWAKRAGHPIPKFKEIDSQALDRLLVSGEVEAISSSILSGPGLEAATSDIGEELVTLELAEHGLEPYYGTGVIVSDGFADENPDAIRAWVDATIRSFAWCFENKEQAAAEMVELYPTFTEETVVAALEQLEKASTDGGALELDEIGGLDPAKVEATIEIVEEALDIDVDVDSLYTTQYLD